MANAVDLGVDSVYDCLTITFGLTDGITRGDEYIIHCVNPKHSDAEPSTGVNLGTGYWHCWSCGIGGDLLDLGKRVLGVPQREVRELLKPSTPEAVLANVQRRLARIALPARVRRKAPGIELPGPYDDGPLDELKERGFTENTLQQWGVRYVKSQTLTGNDGEFTIANCIAIPIRDAQGKLLAWCYRATADSARWQRDSARYIYTPGFPISEVWFGLHQLAPRTHHINVVEGALDTMWLHQCGFPTLGLLGSHMGVRKIKWLQQFRSVTLFPDRDNAGASWVERVGREIGTRTQVYVVLYDMRIVRAYIDPADPDKRKRKLDPQMLAPIDVELMVEGRITWTSYLRRISA